jgi:hypothetical protein
MDLGLGYCRANRSIRRDSRPLDRLEPANATTLEKWGILVARKQYMFTPPVVDPRASADLLWDEMRDELNITRDALEQSEAREVANAALIDMLRKEIDAAKDSQTRDRTAVIRMETKLKAAGMLILDALKDKPDDEEERPKQKRALQDLPPVRRETQRADPGPPPSPSAAFLPEVEDEEATAREVVSSIHKLANRWP